MSQTVGTTGKTVSGNICTLICNLGDESYIYVKWHTDNRLDLVCTDGENEETIPLDLGFWFRTWPILLIISYDTENYRIEATALSCHKGLVSGGVDLEIDPPSAVRWGDQDGENVYNLIICGTAFNDEYMDQLDRETHLLYLEFLTPP